MAFSECFSPWRALEVAMVWDWAVAMLMSHTHAVLASGIQGQHRHHGRGTSFPFIQSLVCIIHVSFHYWAYHSLSFPENSCIRKVFCLEWIRMSIFCNSASKITRVSPWVLSMIINSAVKLKDSKILLVFVGHLSFTPGRSFTWGFTQCNASKLNCEYKIPCTKMKMLSLLTVWG